MRDGTGAWIGRVLLVAGAAMAQACTVCDSAAGHAVRGQLADGHFLQTAALVAAPFPVFGLVGVWLYRWLPVPGAASERDFR